MTNDELLAKLKGLAERQDAAKQAQKAPCPSCGHCPTCGHAPFRTVPVPLQPYIPRWVYVPYVQPITPTYPGPTWTLTTTDTPYFAGTTTTSS